jgi:hypothetical protein
MNTSRLSFNRCVWLALALAAAAGSSTLQYRTVQSRFENAVRADNERFTLPFTDVAGRYRAVAGELTPEYLARLDEKLRPNAWTLRAVAQWRAGEFTPSVASALESLAEITRQRPQSPQLENGRDSILLTRIPGLVEDSRLRQRFHERAAATRLLSAPSCTISRSTAASCAACGSNSRSFGPSPGVADKTKEAELKATRAVARWPADSSKRLSSPSASASQ